MKASWCTRKSSTGDFAPGPAPCQPGFAASSKHASQGSAESASRVPRYAFGWLGRYANLRFSTSQIRGRQRRCRPFAFGSTRAAAGQWTDAHLAQAHHVAVVLQADMPTARPGEAGLRDELAGGHAAAPVVAVEIVGGDLAAVEPMLDPRAAGDDPCLVVLLRRTQYRTLRRDQIVDRSGTVRGFEAVFGRGIVEQLVFGRTPPDGFDIGGAIEQAAVAARRQPPFELQFEIVVLRIADDIAAAGRGEREFAIDYLPARIQRALADVVPAGGGAAIEQPLPLRRLRPGRTRRSAQRWPGTRPVSACVLAIASACSSANGKVRSVPMRSAP